MTALDTNILVRYFVKDDPQETRLATNIVGSLSLTEPGWIGVVVLAEVVWTLKRIYHFSRAGITRIVEVLLSSEEIVIEQEVAVRDAFALYRNCRADFADCLIAASAKAAGCARTVTFDRIAARDAGMELVQ